MKPIATCRGIEAISRDLRPQHPEGCTISEASCAPIAYVYGGITLSPKPPGPFNIGLRVDVGPLTAAVADPAKGDTYLVWHYLAVVKPGPTTVRCTIGDVTVTKEVEAKPGEVSLVNFCFGQPVDMGPANKLPKPRIPSRRLERARNRAVTGETSPQAGS